MAWNHTTPNTRYDFYYARLTRALSYFWTSHESDIKIPFENVKYKIDTSRLNAKSKQRMRRSSRFHHKRRKQIHYSSSLSWHDVAVSIQK